MIPEPKLDALVARHQAVERELASPVTPEIYVKLAFDCLVTGDERIEFWLRNHGRANPGCNAGCFGCGVARGSSAGAMLVEDMRLR